MPRTKYSIPEPIPYEDQLDMIDKKELIAHALRLEQMLDGQDSSIATLTERIEKQEAEIIRLLDKLKEPIGAPSPTSTPEFKALQKSLEEEQRRATALERDNRHLRSQMAHGGSGATALDVEDQKQIAAFLKLLEDGGTTYYPKAVSRSFVTAVRRALALNTEE